MSYSFERHLVRSGKLILYRYLYFILQVVCHAIFAAVSVCTLGIEFGICFEFKSTINGKFFNF
jgi:hypothetical protein